MNVQNSTMPISGRLREFVYRYILVNFRRRPRLLKFMTEAFHKTASVAFRRKGVKKIRFAGLTALFDVGSSSKLMGIEGTFLPLKNGGERETLEKLLGLLRKGDTAWDVGASIGVFAVLMCLKVGLRGRVYAFEPEPKSFDILRMNVELNRLKQAQIVDCALGSIEKTGRLYSYGRGFGPANLMGHGDVATEIRIRPGDLILKDLQWPIPRLIKIDVEGYEFDVLQGLERTLRDERCEIVLCEVHPTLLPRGISETDIRRTLEASGFIQFDRTGRENTIHLFGIKAPCPAREL